MGFRFKKRLDFFQKLLSFWHDTLGQRFWKFRAKHSILVFFIVTVMKISVFDEFCGDFLNILWKAHFFLLTDFKGNFDIILDVRCFSLIFTFLNTLLCLLFRCIWWFLLNFSVFWLLLLEQYRVTNFRREKKHKCVFHVLPSKNPWASHEKSWMIPVFKTYPTRK